MQQQSQHLSFYILKFCVHVSVDAHGNYSNTGPNAQGFDAFGSGVADRQGTLSGISSTGVASY
ncbi:MAG: hypothetical protein QMB96_10475, partial [Acinetobacter towneri]